MKPTKSPRILVVDDEPLNLALVLEYLQDYNFDLVTAEDGVEALERVREQRPDLILLDIIMPRLSGYKVCRRLKKSATNRDIPIIFLSALKSPKHIVHGLRVGAVDYIRKPFVPAELLARVTLHLEQYRIRRNLQQRLQTLEARIPPEADRPIEEPRQTSSDEALRSIEWVSAYLLENLDATPSLDELARIGHTNRTSLNRSFQHAFGYTIFEWLVEQRLLRAAKLLRSTDRLIVDIALSVGYESHAGFSNAFKNRFGLSPSQYRSQTQASSPQGEGDTPTLPPLVPPSDAT